MAKKTRKKSDEDLADKMAKFMSGKSMPMKRKKALQTMKRIHSRR